MFESVADSIDGSRGEGGVSARYIAGQLGLRRWQLYSRFFPGPKM